MGNHDKIKIDSANSSSLRQKVFIAIEDAVLSGRYKPGECLVESKLATELGVSRTPVREALTQLEREGLVELVPNKGALVTGISPKDIQDIYTIRIMIEGLAARWAAEYIDEEELKELQDAIELEEFYTLKNDIEHLIQLDSRFHHIIYKASKSRPLLYMLKTFHQYIQHARTLSLERPGRAYKALQEHKLIFQAIKEHDGQRAEQLTADHIRKASANLLNVINSGK
ncbi:MAG: GntR family transcriptional regulator [Desulfobacterota bacterium]|nr:GntR family transcriptional regulator [Thermodesulfobacteriota bacterium]